jgi:hypothetical protein
MKTEILKQFGGRHQKMFASNYRTYWFGEEERALIYWVKGKCWDLHGVLIEVYLKMDHLPFGEYLLNPETLEVKKYKYTSEPGWYVFDYYQYHKDMIELYKKITNLSL